MCSAAEEEDLLLKAIDASPAKRWTPLLGRKLQSLGGLPRSGGMRPDPLPPMATSIIDALVAAGVFDSSSLPNHVLLNEYAVGQGIAPHWDGPLYHPRVAILSLGSHCTFHFFKRRPPLDAVVARDGATVEPASPEPKKLECIADISAEEFSLLLPPRGLLVFDQAAASAPRHMILLCALPSHGRTFIAHASQPDLPHRRMRTPTIYIVYRLSQSIPISRVLTTFDYAACRALPCSVSTFTVAINAKTRSQSGYLQHTACPLSRHSTHASRLAPQVQQPLLFQPNLSSLAPPHMPISALLVRQACCALTFLQMLHLPTVRHRHPGNAVFHSPFERYSPYSPPRTPLTPSEVSRMCPHSHRGRSARSSRGGWMVHTIQRPELPAV